MKPYRDVATVVALQLVCFFLLIHLEPSFFLIHLYESILYIAIWVLLFYMEDRWAYMIGMLASVVWLGLAYAAGILSNGFNLLRDMGSGGSPADSVGLIALATTVLSILMIVLCGRHWIKEYSGLGKTRSTFFISLGIVGVYYAILLHWFWDMIPNA